MEVIDIHAITQVDSSGSSYVDGRPCFSPDGKTVLFERRGGGISLNEFWSIPIDNPGSEKVYYTSSTYNCLSAAWSWNPNQKNNQIAFTANSNGISKIMLLDAGGAPNSAQELTIQGYQANIRLSYPAWYGNEMALLITDYNALNLIKATTHGEFLGIVSSATKWSGMGTVSSLNRNVIAYAGQSMSANGYNQNVNQIWIQTPGRAPALFSSKDKGTIGRAPWISPDGKMIAFEALSNGTSGNMQIFLKQITNAPYDQPIVSVSNANNPSQHAKFSPDGTKLVWMQTTAPGKTQIFLGTIHM